jgi:branched-chain amino acid transport system permease protein
MLIVGGASSLSGAVFGTLFVTFVVEVLRQLEAGVTMSGHTLALPKYSQEIGLGLVLALILIFRSGGLTNGYEIPFPFRRLSRSAAERSTNGSVTSV